MGILYIVPTPIGNLQDITIRSLEVLFSVPYIACEDTRKTGFLLHLLKEKYFSLYASLELTQNDTKIKNDEGMFLSFSKKNVGKSTNPQLFSYYDQVEKERIPAVLNILKNDFDVALVSDAGTPLVSDPGFKLVRACYEAHIQVNSLPGASSLLVALTTSGLPTDKFSFLGYPPQKSGHRMSFYEDIKKSSEVFSTTYILFEAPHKIVKTLEEMQEIFGKIEIVLCRELTKLHEEIFRGSIETAIKKYDLQARGEFVILFHL